MIRRLSSLDAARTTWTRIADAQDNVFATWEWADAWWRHFGDRHRLFLHEVRDATGTPIGILPLYAPSASRGLVLRFIGHGVADQLGPVCAPEHRDAAVAALRTLRRPRLLLAEHLRADEHWMEGLGGHALRSESFALIDLRGLSWDDWLATKSSNFRSQARRDERRAARAGRLEFELVDAPRDADVALETLIRLHEARWGGSSVAFAGRRRDFHHEFARAAAERGWLRLWMARINRRPVAAWIGYRFGGTMSSYLMGRLPEYDALHVGSVLRLHTIRQATGDVREYRLLRGDEAYKRRLATSDPGVHTIIVGPPPLNLATRAVIRHKHLVPAVARHRLSAGLAR